MTSGKPKVGTRPDLVQVRAVLRVLVLLVIWAVWLWVARLTLALTTIGGQDLGWLWAILVLAPLVGVTWLLWQHRRRQRAATIAAAVLVAVFGVVLFMLMPPSLTRVDRVSANLPVPTDATVLSTSSVDNDLCFGQCSRVERVYAVEDADTAIAALQAGLRRDGWRQVEDRWCQGLSFSVLATYGPSGVQAIGYPTPPPGRELMVVTTYGGC